MATRSDERFEELQRTRSRRLRNELVAEYRRLADLIAGDYSHRGVELDDLRQVALLALVKAVERFEPTNGAPFTAFARITINGELKRYFRDQTWAVRPPRSLQEAYLEVRQVVDELSRVLGRAPTPVEVAEQTGMTRDEVINALEAGAAYRPEQLDAPVNNSSSGSSNGPLTMELADDEEGFDHVELRTMVSELLANLGERDAAIVRMRFYDEMTQTQIANELGISQMQVSRLLRRGLATMRAAVPADIPA